MNTSENDQAVYDQLALYTLAHAASDPSFIHQYVVDAYAAQHASENSKPITVAFALIGLYLHLEKDFSGREVQLAHMELAREKKEWPRFKIPQDMGNITVKDVLEALPGKERDEMIRKWCVSVWEAWRESHEEVRELWVSHR